MTRMVNCVKLGKPAEGLEQQPYPGELGERIFNSVSRQAWQEWQEHQTRVINEYQLQLADPKARAFLEEEMEKYFFGGGDLTQTHYVPPEDTDGGNQS